jgi:phosphotriesterase-related protein
VAETVNTTTGPIAVAALGRTLIHEHVLVGFPGWFMDRRQPPFRRAEAVARVVDAFAALHDYGVRTVVDPCPMDMGRDVELIAEVSQRSGINLICTTGAYTERQGIPHTFRHLDVAAITEIYIREIDDGVGATGIKAGLIKIATDDGEVSAYERKLITAAARAARSTGTPIISHTENCTCGHEQIDIVTGEGLAASRLLVGHSDGRDDHPYQRSLAERGAYVGFDRFGVEMIIPDAIRTKNLKLLIDGGYEDQVMVSHDMVNCFLGAVPRLGTADMSQILPNWRMTHLFENIFPELRRMGVSEVQLDHIVTENPRRFFAAAGAFSKGPSGSWKDPYS